MFTQNHFLWLGVCAVAIIVGLVIAKRKNLSAKAAAYIMAAICLVSEVSKMADEIIESDFGGFILNPKALPFHLCSLMIFAVFYIAFTKNEKGKAVVLSFLAPVGILGGIAAMLIPTNGVSFTSLGAYQCFVYHAGLVWYALYSIIAEHTRLGLREYGRNIAILGGLFIMDLYVNSVLSAYGTNFMYLVRPPMENLPVLNLDNGWFAYIGSLLALGIVLMTIVHLPFMIAEAARKKRENKTE